jgi:fluoride ion exporter CrcB/FEX
MSQTFKDIFADLFKINRFPVNFIGGLALGLLFEKFISSQLLSVNFLIGFFCGFVYMNSLVKEVNTITIKGMYYRLAIVVIGFILLYFFRLIK